MTPAENGSTFYDFLFTDLADPRTNGWFLMPSPVPILTMMGTYLFCVTVWGPRCMRNRKPVKLNFVLKVYNFLQMLLSSFLVYEAADGLMLRKDYSLRCQPLTVERTKESMREANCVYFYFLAKLTELLDTLFFVLRKKDSQITFLHVYHHTVMPIFSWGFAKYSPGGHIIFTAFINSLVHVIMYMYYMLAAFGPTFQKYLRWKKYITLMQMIQFVMVFLHNAQLLYTDCNYPKASLIIMFSHAFFFMYLFGNFYRSAYEKDGKSFSKKSEGDLKPHRN